MGWVRTSICSETLDSCNGTEVLEFRTKEEEDEVLTWGGDDSGGDLGAGDVKTSIPTTGELAVSIGLRDSEGNEINIEELGSADVGEDVLSESL